MNFMTITPKSMLCLIVLVLTTACGGARASRLASGDMSARQTIVVNGTERTYVIRVPERVTATTRVPLVIVLHGGGGDALNGERMTGFTAKAKEEGFFVVYPDGSGRRRTTLLTWNAGHCCGPAMEGGVDDVAFIAALIDKLSHQYAIDPARIYVTGMSNGAMMAHRLGTELSDRIAAIAPVVGAVFGDEQQPVHAVSAIMINGLLDKSIPYSGGLTGGRSGAWDGTPMRAALSQGTFWAAANGCSAAGRAQDHGPYVRHSHDCPAGRAVEVYIVEDNGHAWPGGERGSQRGDKPSTSLNATDVIWRFFETHPKP